MAIDITGIDLVEFIKKAYEMSIPAGLGHMHYRPGPLSDEDAYLILEGKNCHSGRLAVGDVFSMDYVHGRCVKLSAWEKGDKVMTGDIWHDHTGEQYAELLGHFDIKYENRKAHGIACHCVVCQSERAKR